jgi:hypothetical protein
VSDGFWENPRIGLCGALSSGIQRRSSATVWLYYQFVGQLPRGPGAPKTTATRCSVVVSRCDGKVAVPTAHPPQPGESFNVTDFGHMPRARTPPRGTARTTRRCPAARGRRRSRPSTPRTPGRSTLSAGRPPNHCAGICRQATPRCSRRWPASVLASSHLAVRSASPVPPDVDVAAFGAPAESRRNGERSAGRTPARGPVAWRATPRPVGGPEPVPGQRGPHRRRRASTVHHRVSRSISVITMPGPEQHFQRLGR